MDRTTFGGDTRIPPTVRLILMDCFETLVELESTGYRARRGIGDFLDHFTKRKGVPVAVVSDAEEILVLKALDQAGLKKRFKAVFHRGNASRLLDDGRHRKDLAPVLAHFRIPVEQTVFIGDSPLDGEAAKEASVPFVRVPRSEDRGFTFTRLITGASRYHSGEFSAQFLDAYLARQPEGDVR
ncbi:MAG: Haloacid dehalogenase-like hydrolase [Planctomycetota bacterium]|jgi:phosphoglycolate phosphatase-like HAD superfamily hydrolase